MAQAFLASMAQAFVASAAQAAATDVVTSSEEMLVKSGLLF